MVATAIRFEDPSLARFLFSDPRLAWLWLPLRVRLGWRWLDAERHNSPAQEWMETGDAIRVLLGRAAAIPEQGRPLVAYDPTAISNASFRKAVIVCGLPSW